MFSSQNTAWNWNPIFFKSFLNSDFHNSYFLLSWLTPVNSRTVKPKNKDKSKSWSATQRISQLTDYPPVSLVLGKFALGKLEWDRDYENIWFRKAAGRRKHLKLRCRLYLFILGGGIGKWFGMWWVITWKSPTVTDWRSQKRALSTSSRRTGFNKRGPFRLNSINSLATPAVVISLQAAFIIQTNQTRGSASQRRTTFIR